jgi:cyclohexadieny/prephenate dehydrogenase
LTGVAVTFDRIAVLGLGLLGGSVAAAVRRSGIARTIAGATRSQEASAWALEQGWVDSVGTPADAVEGADLVVLATPVYAMVELLRSLSPALRDAAIVTDVGSVKANLAETLPGLLPNGVFYVGSHPMAGSHARGIEYASESLFDGSTCIVTGPPGTPQSDTVCAFWKALGARIQIRTPEEHDAEVAWTSHVPHALAFAFAAAFGLSPDGASRVAGAGFRDFTRIAQSDPELWADILTANRKAIAAPLAEVAESLAELSRAIESNEPDAVERTIANARMALARLAPDEVGG